MRSLLLRQAHAVASLLALATRSPAGGGAGLTQHEVNRLSGLENNYARRTRTMPPDAWTWVRCRYRALGLDDGMPENRIDDQPPSPPRTGLFSEPCPDCDGAIGLHRIGCPNPNRTQVVFLTNTGPVRTDDDH